MPEARLQRTRDAYGAAYDERRANVPTSVTVSLPSPWRAPHVNAAEQLKRQADAHLGARREAE